MNTQYHTTTTTPAIPVSEELVDIPSSMNQPEVFGNYPSDFIKGLDGKWNASAYELTARDKKNIFDILRVMVDADSNGDVDGKHYQVDYKVFVIDAIHHYEVREVRGGDSYMGFFESYSVVDRDSFEIAKISDEEGRDYPAKVLVLNQYAKQNNL